MARRDIVAKIGGRIRESSHMLHRWMSGLLPKVMGDARSLFEGE